MFSSWIMSIVIIACVGVLLDIIIPEGEMEKYVKGIFSILVIFVIISPLPAILKKDWKLEFESLGSETVKVDENFIEDLKEDEYKNQEKNLSTLLNQKFGSCEVSVIRNNLGEIIFVIVDFKKTGISENHTNNINVDSVKEEVKSLLGVSLEQVIIYE